MIIGVGTDLLKTERVVNALRKFPRRFPERILAGEELALFEKIEGEREKVAFLAKRFAAKEALAKAFGTGLREPVHMRLMVLASDPMGKPVMEVRGELAKHMERMGGARIHLSLSDESDAVLAFVVMEG